MSYGVLRCNGVSNSIFCCDKKATYTLFNKLVLKKRYEEVLRKIKSFNWSPTFNNLKGLYLENGRDWRHTPIQAADELNTKEAWADMPKDMLDYIRSLPEFNAEIFKKITGV